MRAGSLGVFYRERVCSIPSDVVTALRFAPREVASSDKMKLAVVPEIASRRAAIAAALVVLGAAPPRPLSATQADKVDTETGKLVLNNPPTIDVKAAPPKVTSRCFLDVAIGSDPRPSRLEIDLYGEVAPRAAENFRALCTGEKGFGYAGSSFYKILRGIALQGGDVDGKGAGRSIYGEPFAHDNYSIMHNKAGIISMVNSGVGGSSGTSDSRFLIQPNDDSGFLDGRYEAFGRVTSGLGVVQRLNDVPVSGTKQIPQEKVKIVAAGEIALAPPPPPPTEGS